MSTLTPGDIVFFCLVFSVFPFLSFLALPKFLRSGKSTGQCLGTKADISIDPEPLRQVEVCSRRPRDVFPVQKGDPIRGNSTVVGVKPDVSIGLTRLIESALIFFFSHHVLVLLPRKKKSTFGKSPDASARL